VTNEGFEVGEACFCFKKLSLDQKRSCVRKLTIKSKYILFFDKLYHVDCRAFEKSMIGRFQAESESTSTEMNRLDEI
jgi:hypothetical protein